MFDVKSIAMSDDDFAPQPPKGTPKPRYVVCVNFGHQVLKLREWNRADAILCAEMHNSPALGVSAYALSILSNGRRVRIGGAR